MENLNELLQAIENATSIDEIKQIKIDFGYTQILNKVTKTTIQTRDKINLKEAKQGKENRIKDRKILLKKYVGEMIFYVGKPYKKLYKNRPCKLIKVNKTRCVVEFSGKDGSWTIPLLELYPQKTNSKYITFTKNGFKLV
jgi:hypothetical protein